MSKSSDSGGSTASLSARARGRRLSLLTALRAHANAPSKTDLLWETLRPRKLRGRARTVPAEVEEVVADGEVPLLDLGGQVHHEDLGLRVQLLLLLPLRLRSADGMPWRCDGDDDALVLAMGR
jgi:hypothetical protein